MIADIDSAFTLGYVYDLVNGTGGEIIPVSEITEIVPMSMSMRFLSAQSNTPNNSVISRAVRGKIQLLVITSIYSKTFMAMTANGYQTIVLDDYLKDDRKADTDSDGIPDYDEVFWGGDLIKTEIDRNSVSGERYIILPTIQECRDYASKNGTLTYVKAAMDRYIDSLIDVSMVEYDKAINCRILPITSNPVDPDSDGDGIADGSKPLLKSNPNYIKDTYINDPKPLKWSYMYYDDELQRIKKSYPNAKFVFEEYNFKLGDFVDLQYESSYHLTAEERFRTVASEQKRLRAIANINYPGMFFSTKEGIRHYCEVITYLDKNHIFAFREVSLQNNPSLEEAQQMLANTYFNNDGKLKEYAQYFVDASIESGVDLSFIIGKFLVECGNGGSSLSKGNVASSGKSAGQIVYNMYAIGAFDNGDSIGAGVLRASNEGWTTERSAIIGGAKYICGDFLERGQSTPYTQRFNIIQYSQNKAMGYQYATAINYVYVGAETVAKEAGGTLNNLSMIFTIPIFEED